MHTRAKLPAPAPEPGLVVEIAAEEYFLIEVPSSTERQTIRVTMESKAGQRARLRIVAPPAVSLVRRAFRSLTANLAGTFSGST